MSEYTSMEFYNSTIEAIEDRYESHRSLLEKIAIDLGHGDRVDELIEKFLGEPIKFKKRRDPRQPKRPLSGYLQFCKSQRLKIKEDYPELKMTELSSKMGQIWKNLSEDERKPYNEAFLTDKDRYEAEMEEFIASKDY